MTKPTAVEALKESIRLLEIRQEEEGKILKEQFRITYDSLKPINFIKNSLKDLTESMEIKTGVFETIVSILTGYFTKKIMVSSKSSLFKRILGALLQFGVTSVLAKNAESIRSFLADLVDKFFHPEEEEGDDVIQVDSPETSKD